MAGIVPEATYSEKERIRSQIRNATMAISV